MRYTQQIILCFLTRQIYNIVIELRSQVDCVLLWWELARDTALIGRHSGFLHASNVCQCYLVIKEVLSFKRTLLQATVLAKVHSKGQAVFSSPQMMILLSHILEF